MLMALPERVSGALKVRALSRPSDEVAVSAYVPLLCPTRIFPKLGAVVSPVPPYMTPTEVVAETMPLFAWSGPLSEPMARLVVVAPWLKVCGALKVLVVVVEKAVVKTPVALLYASGYVAESDDEEILLVKSVKSVDER
jgi:hypothetical protein